MESVERNERERESIRPASARAVRGGVRAVGLLERFSGPRSGRARLRGLHGVAGRPPLCTALKPMRLSNGVIAEQTCQFAPAGLDLMTDDHGIAGGDLAANCAFCLEMVAGGASSKR